MAGKRLKHLQPEKAGENSDIRKLPNRMARLEYKFTHTHLIFIGGLLQEVLKALAAARLIFFKKVKERLLACRYFHAITRTKIYCIRRIHTNQLVVVLHGFAKKIEKRFEHLRHPIPTGTHIKNEAIDRKLSCAPTRTTVFLEYRYFKPLFCQTAGCG